MTLENIPSAVSNLPRADCAYPSNQFTLFTVQTSGRTDRCRVACELSCEHIKPEIRRVTDMAPYFTFIFFPRSKSSRKASNIILTNITRRRGE